MHSHIYMVTCTCTEWNNVTKIKCTYKKLQSPIRQIKDIHVFTYQQKMLGMFVAYTQISRCYQIRTTSRRINDAYVIHLKSKEDWFGSGTSLKQNHAKIGDLLKYINSPHKLLTLNHHILNFLADIFNPYCDYEITFQTDWIFLRLICQFLPLA